MVNGPNDPISEIDHIHSQAKRGRSSSVAGNGVPPDIASGSGVVKNSWELRTQWPCHVPSCSSKTYAKGDQTLYLHNTMTPAPLARRPVDRRVWLSSLAAKEKTA